MTKGNGFNRIPARSSPAATQQAVTCRCGSPDFDQVDRARLFYDRLDPQMRPILVPAKAFVCSACQEPLIYTERVKEISAGDGEKGIVTG